MWEAEEPCMCPLKSLQEHAEPTGSGPCSQNSHSPGFNSPTNPLFWAPPQACTPQTHPTQWLLCVTLLCSASPRSSGLRPWGLITGRLPQKRKRRGGCQTRQAGSARLTFPPEDFGHPLCLQSARPAPSALAQPGTASAPSWWGLWTGTEHYAKAAHPQ